MARQKQWEEYSWVDKLKGLASNTWLYPNEREHILKVADSLNEQDAKAKYIAIDSEIKSRLQYWRNS